jgi:hypothetical protein
MITYSKYQWYFFELSMIFTHISMIFSGLSMIFTHISMIFSGLSMIFTHISMIFSELSMIFTHISMIFMQISMINNADINDISKTYQWFLSGNNVTGQKSLRSFAYIIDICVVYHWYLHKYHWYMREYHW